jgi:hypothetical protein
MLRPRYDLRRVWKEFTAETLLVSVVAYSTATIFHIGRYSSFELRCLDAANERKNQEKVALDGATAASAD